MNKGGKLEVRISFDVESLFTNIPLEECIDLAVKYISEGNPDLKHIHTYLFHIYLKSYRRCTNPQIA